MIFLDLEKNDYSTRIKTLMKVFWVFCVWLQLAAMFPAVAQENGKRVLTVEDLLPTLGFELHELRPLGYPYGKLKALSFGSSKNGNRPQGCLYLQYKHPEMLSMESAWSDEVKRQAVVIGIGIKDDTLRGEVLTDVCDPRIPDFKDGSFKVMSRHVETISHTQEVLEMGLFELDQLQRVCARVSQVTSLRFQQLAEQTQRLLDRLDPIMHRVRAAARAVSSADEEKSFYEQAFAGKVQRLDRFKPIAIVQTNNLNKNGCATAQTWAEGSFSRHAELVKDTESVPQWNP